MSRVPKTLNQVDGVLGREHDALADRSGKWTIGLGSDGKDMGGNPILASQSPFSNSVTLRPEFFRTPGEQVQTMAHEFAHPFLARVPELYDNTGMYGAALFFPWWARNNAETYSHFVTGAH